MRNYWNSKLSNYLIGIFVAVSTLTHAQLSPDKSLPGRVLEEPYLFPISPGHANGLTGTMGEFRTNHFHSGIDIRTNNSIGMPVQATQRGYVSRIIVGAYGYGHALLVKHPDGNESLYGHLDHFNSRIAEFVLRRQYETKSFDQDIALSPNQFPIQRGDTIAFSGNTGGSAGPHLHFEIRDGQNRALNPLAFSFSEIVDVLAPVAQRIAFRPLDGRARVGREYERKEFALQKKGNDYYLPQPVTASGKIGVELLAFDRLDLSRFRCGINETELWLDSQRVFVQRIDRIGFPEYRELASVVNHQTLKARGLQFNKLYRENGNRLSFYSNSKETGVLTINKSVTGMIVLRDQQGNTSRVHFQLAPPNSAAVETIIPSYKINASDFASRDGNVLSFHTSCGEAPQFFQKGTLLPAVTEAYKSYGKHVYLLDLKTAIPDSVKTCLGVTAFNIQDEIPSGVEYTYYSDWATVRLTPQSLYDTLYLVQQKTKEGTTDVFTLGNDVDALRQEVEITLKPEVANTKHAAVYRKSGRHFDYRGGSWENGAVRFKTREWGNFVVLHDSIAPIIQRYQCNQTGARFRILDNLSGIASYEATVNGEWLLMKYDYKTGILFSERLDKTKPLHGLFTLKVTDRSGNEKIYSQQIP